MDEVYDETALLNAFSVEHEECTPGGMERHRAAEAGRYPSYLRQRVWRAVCVNWVENRLDTRIRQPNKVLELLPVLLRPLCPAHFPAPPLLAQPGPCLRRQQS